MNLNIIFGILFLIYGIYTFIQRKKNPEKFSKLQNMKQSFGEKKGTFIHIIFYTVLPIIIGIILIIRENL